MLDFRSSRSLHGHVGNAMYGAADFLAQPVVMLIAAPPLVHLLGLQQYGIWMLVAAVLGSMGTLSAGFGDATIKYVSTYRALGDTAQVQRTIKAALTINAVLGAVLGAAVWLAAPAAALHVFKIEPQFQQASILALRIASVIMFVRSLESVFVSVLRAYEFYGPSVKINVIGRSSTVAAAVFLAAFHYGVVGIMYASLLVALIGAGLQALAVRRHTGQFSLLPGFHRATFVEMARFGCYSWLQALAGVFFIHGDRFLVAAMLGTSEVAYYSICVQATQPVHGLLASALNFLFPRLSSRYESADVPGTMRLYSRSIWINFGAAALLALPLTFFSSGILRLWMGPAVAQNAHTVFSVLAIAYGILAINVVPHYSLLAAGRVKYVSFVNILGGVLSLAGAVVLIPYFGLLGAALGRLLYGPAVSLNFLKARACLQQPRTVLVFE